MESRKYRDCPENGFLMKMLAGMDVLEHSACSFSSAHVWTNKESYLRGPLGKSRGKHPSQATVMGTCSAWVVTEGMSGGEDFPTD